MRKLPIDIVRQQGLSKGFELISDIYNGNKSKLRWRCPAGHEFLSRSNDIVSGYGCKKCGVLSRAENRKSEDSFLHELAANKNGQWIGPNNVNCMTKTGWRDHLGHEWQASPNRIQQGDWCPFCSSNGRKGFNHYIKYAAKRGGLCLSSEADYLAEGMSQSKLKWQCAKGHIWQTNPYSIKSGSWCRECRSGSWGQDLIFDYVLSLGVAALKNQKKLLPERPRLELDIWIPSQRKAIEYDGLGFHSKPEVVARDKAKDTLCVQHGIKLMRICSKQFSRKVDQILAEVKAFLLDQ